MRCKQYSILIASLIAFSIISADPMPWWEVSYSLDIQYPSMGDYKWEKGSDKLIVKGKAENRRSFYIHPFLGFCSLKWSLKFYQKMTGYISLD